MPKRALHNYTVYILTNKKLGVLYTGMTGGLDDRLLRHRLGQGSKFTKKYNASK
ncbi:GIY-YIG nuclease family protein [Nonlabens ulvanivorans]|nr:GIY-YIG nuclease family protein [Nonlabens ulvanivorans]